jgi:hypothetical protein
MKKHLIYFTISATLLLSCQKSLSPENVYLDAEAKAKLTAEVQKDQLLKEYGEASFKSTSLMRQGMKAPGFNIEEFKAQTQKIADGGKINNSNGDDFASAMTKALKASGFGNVEEYITALENERLLQKKLHAKYPGLTQFDGREWLQLINPVMIEVYQKNGQSWIAKPQTPNQ